MGLLSHNVFQRVLYERIENILIKSCQLSFLGAAKTTSLIQLDLYVGKMEKSIDKNKFVCAVFMDFDIAKNDILIAKSRTNGNLIMHCHMWLTSSKTNTTQLVVMVHSVLGKKS